MKFTTAALLTLMFNFTTARAEPALVLACVFAEDEETVIDRLAEWANAPAGGVLVTNEVEGIALARETFRRATLTTLHGRPGALVNAPKILRIDVDPTTHRRVCAIVEGEVYARVPGR